jgi:integrase
VQKRTGQIIPWVFHRDGVMIKDFLDGWHTACEIAGLAGRIPHDFRRTAVRRYERAGVARSVAMKLTGHKTESVYRRYAIVASADLRAGLSKVAALPAAATPAAQVVAIAGTSEPTAQVAPKSRRNRGRSATIGAL